MRVAAHNHCGVAAMTQTICSEYQHFYEEAVVSHVEIATNNSSSTLFLQRILQVQFVRMFERRIGPSICAKEGVGRHHHESS